MSAIITIQNIASDLVTTLWTPIFVAIFLAIVTYALWPRNKAAFDTAARMPLRGGGHPGSKHSACILCSDGSLFPHLLGILLVDRLSSVAAAVGQPAGHPAF